MPRPIAVDASGHVGLVEGRDGPSSRLGPSFFSSQRRDLPPQIVPGLCLPPAHRVRQIQLFPPKKVLQHAPPSVQAHSFRFCQVSEQSAECSCDGFELLAVDAEPRDAVDDRRTGSTGRSGQCGPSGTSSLEKNQTEAFGIPLDISVGHGEQIARRVPARQVVVAHMAEQMHAIRYTELRREARQVFPILANANQRVMCVDALLAGRSPSSAQNPSIGCSIKWKR